MRMSNRITPKQQRFVEEYIIDLNATAAAGRAGYSDPNFGRQLITKPNVSEHIQQLREKLSKKNMITAETVLADIIRRGMLAEEAGQFGPAIKATELLAKYLGMFVDRQETSGILKIVVERHD